MPQSFSKLIWLLLLGLLPTLAYGQVSASFTVDNASGCMPLIVHFTNTSSDALSYSWNLGNSTTSSATDPSAGYTAAGAYTVTLTAYNGASSSTFSMVIDVYPLPVVNFTASPLNMCLGVPATYTNMTAPGTAGTATYTWNFGDGSTSPVFSPMYAHALPGFYNITLFATNSRGCSQSLTKPSYVQVYSKPVPAFSASETNICHPPMASAFTNTSSGSLPLAYDWNFGDGFTSAAVSPTHVYSTAGSFNTRLKVTDGHGCVDSVTYYDHVRVSGMVAAFTTPASTCQGGIVAFTNTSSAYIFSDWSFGDLSTSVEDMAFHTYSLPGVYNTRLIVTDGICFDTVTHPVTINPNPTATFTITPSIPCPVPVTVNYAATLSAGATATWEFMDNTIGTGATTSHLYSSLNLLIDTVTLTATNAFGCKKVVEKIDTTFKLVVHVNPLYRAGCMPLTTSFTTDLEATTYNSFTSEYITVPVPYTVANYNWNFGDGSPTFSGPSPSHTFTAVGVYTVTCSITTTTGCTRSGSTQILVGVPPVVSFTATPTTRVCAGQVVHYVASGSSTINSYYWNYGEGGDSGVAYNPTSFRYQVPGIDTVRLKAYHNGCPSPEFKMQLIVDSPSARGTAFNTCIPNNGIQFGDSSIGANSIAWDFGDGATSTLHNPIHFYSSLSDYDIKLMTHNILSGCRDTLIKRVYLTPPFVFAAAADPTLCIHDGLVMIPVVLGTPPTDPDKFKFERCNWFVDGVSVIDTPGMDPSFPIPMESGGYHSATLIGKNTRGCYDTLNIPDIVLVGDPIDSFTVSAPNGCGPLNVIFTDHSTSVPIVPIVSYEWTFGDGTPNLISGAPGATHTYPNAGTYDISLLITDIHGCTSTTDPPVQVTVYKPHSAFYADANNVCLGTNVHFNNISTSYATSFWIFGDGGVSTATSPNHMYASSGVYTVKLVTTESHGCTDTATLLNYIYVAPSPSAAFTMSDSFAVCPPLNVNFNNHSVGAVSYNWSFGNSTSSVAANPSSPYSTSGYFPVRLVAYNTLGCTDTATRHVNVFGYSGAFTYSPIAGCMPLSVHFSASLGSVASLVWDFGDGFTSSVSLLDTISHTYPFQGKYVPKLILTDTTGCTNFSVGADTIKADVVIPHFRIAPNPVCQGSSVVFTDSSYSSFAPPTAWAWSFGAGVTAAGSTPSHTFTMAGTYAVTLSVTNANGCTATGIRNVTVNPIPAAITGSFNLCPGTTSLLANITPGGSWSSGSPLIASVSSSGLVTGLLIGTSRITYSLSAGCLSTVVVTVNGLPATITGADVICETNTTTFSSTSSGGTWTSSSPGTATVNPSTGLITGIAAGTADITYSLGTGCIATRPVTVNTMPLPITGTAGLCKNATTTLFESISGGVWSATNPVVATITSAGLVSGLSAGTSGISYSFSTGCKVGTMVTVHPLPDTITGTLTLCDGGITNLYDITSGGTWSSGNPGVAVVHPVIGSVFGLSIGTAPITYSLATGCSVTKVVTVNTIPLPLSGTATVCQNGVTVFFESLSGGSWSSSNTAVASVDAGGTITGIAGGTSQITYSFGTGCFVTKTVTVNPLPDTIAGNPTLCLGYPTIFTNTMSGGVWNSSNPVVATISSTGAVNPISFGTSVISYTLPTGCAKGVEVTVNPIPDPISGPTNVCIGIPTLLTNLTPGGTWSSSDITVVTIDPYSGVYTGVSAGNPMITYTTPAGCYTTKTLTIQALPPVILGGPTVCTGFAVNLSNSMPGGVWSTNPGTYGIGTIHPVTGVVTGITPGTVIVSYTVMTGCVRNLVVTVLVLPAVIGGSPAVCVGDTTILTNATPGGVWSISNPARATINPSTGALAGISAGNAVVTYKVASGCFNVLSIVVNPLPMSITGSAYLCEGGTTNLASSPPGGVWTSQHTDTAIVGTGTGIVTGVMAGTTTITYKLYTGCKATKLVTVSPTPPAITGNPHICIGTSVTYANTMPGGIWLSSNPSVATIDLTTGIATSVAIGTTRITYSMIATGCFASRIVTVHPLPTVYNVTGGGSYCYGAPGVHIGLSGSQPGVSYLVYYGSSATGFTPGTGFTLDYGLLTPAGVYTVHATDVTSGCEKDMAGSATVSVIPLVTPSVTITTMPNDTVCEGTTVMLSAVPVNGGLAPVYVWKVNGALVGGGTGYSFIPADADIVTVAMTSNANCLSTTTANAANTLTVWPYELPAVNVLIDPSDTVCRYTPVTFAASPTYGGSAPAYKWVVNTLDVALGPVYTYIPLDGDVVYCSMISNYLCRTVSTVQSGNVNMTVDTLTTPHIAIIPNPGLLVTAGMTVTLNTVVTDAGPAPTYQWRVNGMPVAGATNATYSGIFNDYDSIVCMVTSSGVCGNIGAFDWVFVSKAALGVLPLVTGDAGITLVPNPNHGSFKLRGSLGTTFDEELSVTVTDMLGQVVYIGAVHAKQGVIDESIALSNELANGMYLLSLESRQVRKVFHFAIKQ